jgi:hypothetical protein
MQLKTNVEPMAPGVCTPGYSKGGPHIALSHEPVAESIDAARYRNCSKQRG